MIGWVDASAGASGDMLLGALLDVGVPLDIVAGAVDAVAPVPVALTPERVDRAGFAALHCRVEPPDSGEDRLRTWVDVRALLEAAPLSALVRGRALRTFERLAEAEARVHGLVADEVHFHEVGAFDAIADVVGVCAGLDHLGLERLVVSTVAVGSGRITTAHGSMPVPPPAVAELLRGAPSYAGPVAMETCTPTGAALLTANADDWGPQPTMTVKVIGTGAGSRDIAGQANVLRLFIGERVPAPSHHASPVVLEANIDDLDPRLWPNVIVAVLDAGASDAWLTPILMKKGRPAHTLSALVTPQSADAVRTAIFRHTTTIGLREVAIAKTALEREMRVVEVAGHAIHVKLARHRGQLVNAQPEYDDVVAAATATGRPVKDVLADAVAASRAL